ncbi:hypothetical protein [Rhodococcus sp. B10]|uniref:hypothetical protein n=1 Tax=Rhodococcus sp. B10 TaxID=2695876 RepID=UPI00142F80AE|nr:hypothetical protein [Rhodococcus sp. B10]
MLELADVERSNIDPVALEAVTPVQTVRFHPGDHAATERVITSRVRTLRSRSDISAHRSLHCPLPNLEPQLLDDLGSREAGLGAHDDFVYIVGGASHIEPIMKETGE